nr:MAG TPA: hypothetical protein [Caudoviricetes sp.]
MIVKIINKRGYKIMLYYLNNGMIVNYINWRYKK